MSTLAIGTPRCSGGCSLVWVHCTCIRGGSPGSLYLHSWWFVRFIVLAFVVVCWFTVPSFRVVLSEVRYVSPRSPRVIPGCRGTPWAILCPSSFSFSLSLSLSLFVLRLSCRSQRLVPVLGYYISWSHAALVRSVGSNVLGSYVAQHIRRTRPVGVPSKSCPVRWVAGAMRWRSPTEHG